MLNTIKTIWSFSKDQHKTLVISLVASFIKSIINVSQILAIIFTTEAILNLIDIKEALIRVIILTIICIIGNYLTSYFEQINCITTGLKMVANKRLSLGKFLQRVPLGYFNQTSSTKLSATLTSTLQGVETASVMALVNIVSGLFNSLALFIFMLFYEWHIGVLIGIGMCCYLILVNYQMKLSRKSAPSLTKAQNNLASASLNFIQGIKVTKSFSVKNGDSKLNEAIKNSREENIKLTKTSMPSQYLASLTIKIFESLILFTTIYLGLINNSLDPLKIIILLIISFMAYASLNQAGSVLSMIGLLDSGLNETKEITNASSLEILEPHEVSQDNEIKFNHVSFSYGDNEVLHDITTTIKESEFTAIIGPSGSGKTTLCELIPRFFEVNSGTITIGGVDIKHMPYEDLMAKVSMVFQRVYLFEDTILNNIRFAKPEASLEEVRKACKLARCDDFIMRLESGYDTVVKEGGASLSGGEKQRISIARAILKDAPIIILDEATSALDSENESEILAAIDELIKNKTVIMIAHRLKSVKKANKIIAIKDGKIVEEGTSTELESKNGLYKDFLNAKAMTTNWKINN